MKTLNLLFVLLFVMVLGASFNFLFIFYASKITENSGNVNVKSDFVSLTVPENPPFINNIKKANDVSVAFHYDGDFMPENTFTGEVPQFYTPQGSSEKFLPVSKTADRKDFLYGQNDYLEIFKSEESHSYQGTPIFISNPYSKYSLSYLGFKISDPSLIKELSVELGIDYNADVLSQSNKKEGFLLASLLGIETVNACGPGLYLRKVGDSNLNFVQESDGVAWYKLEKPIALYDLRLQYSDADCSAMPSYCNNFADDPPVCDNYWGCFYNAKINDLSKGNLRMHIYYKPNDKEGLLRLQVANVLLSDPAGLYYQAIMGQDFSHYYRAYLH